MYTAILNRALVGSPLTIELQQGPPGTALSKAGLKLDEISPYVF